MNPYQSAFENAIAMLKNNSEDLSLSLEVRQYAKTVLMVMEAQQALIKYQEEEEVEELIEFFHK